MKKKLFVLTTFCVLFAANSLFGTEIGQLVIVTEDSIPLRMEPNSQARIAKYAVASLQLQILEISQDRKWYRVKIGEQKGYQLRHAEEYWTFREDVYEQPEKAHAEVRVDVSVLENGNLRNAECIAHRDYVFKSKSLTLDSAYYVGSAYSNKSPLMSCSQPFSTCAQIYKPDLYFLEEDNVKYADVSNLEELGNRYKQLYENGTTTPFYEIRSDSEIETIHEKLICAKLIVTSPGCYDVGYIGTELDVLNNRDYTVNSNHFLSSFPLNSEYLFQTKIEGGVQNLNFLYILKVKYANKQEEMIVRRIFLWWPLCM